MDFNILIYDYDSLCNRSQYFTVRRQLSSLAGAHQQQPVLIPLEIANASFSNFLSLLSRPVITVASMNQAIAQIITNNSLQNLFIFADFFQIDVIFNLLGTVLIESFPKQIPKYLHLLLVHYGPDHSGTKIVVNEIESLLQPDPLQQRYNIIEEMKSKIPLPKIMKQVPAWDLLAIENLKWTKRKISKILRNAFRTRRHLARCQEMTCIMCELTGRYIVDRFAPYTYHWAARVPCCGEFVHRSCIQYFLIYATCKACRTLFLNGKPIMEHDFMPEITQKRNELRIKNDIPLDTVLPDLTL